MHHYMVSVSSHLYLRITAKRTDEGVSGHYAVANVLTCQLKIQRKLDFFLGIGLGLEAILTNHGNEMFHRTLLEQIGDRLSHP